MSQIQLTPVEMTPQVMQDLEDRGLIIRLAPGAHRPPTPPGETVVESVYEGRDQFGPHKLIVVSVNRSQFSAFGTHPDTEDFLLLGDPHSRPLYLVFALSLRDQLLEKIHTRTLSAVDFICLRVRYNDPQVSFFSVPKDVPHGEAVAEIPGEPATFYVTEPRDLPLDLLPLNPYSIRISATTA